MTSKWRPTKGGEVALSDDQLQRIGYAVVLEGHAKAIACSMLRTIEQLSHDKWIKLDHLPLKQICRRLIEQTEGLDSELTSRLEFLEAARDNAHELRHIVVHVTWGEDPGRDGTPTGFDFGRQRLVTVADIDDAMIGCAELKRAANWAAVRVAELIEVGIWPQRPDGEQGMRVATKKGWVRL